MTTLKYINEKKVLEILIAKVGEKEANRMMDEARSIRYSSGIGTKIMNMEPLNKEELEMMKKVGEATNWKGIAIAFNIDPTTTKSWCSQASQRLARWSYRMLKNKQRV